MELPSADRGLTAKTYAHLTILSDILSPDEMEAAVGIAPDRFWAKGERHAGGRRERKFNGIVFESDLDRQRDDPGKHIDAVVQRLSPLSDQIANLARDERVHSARLWLYWNTSGSNPGLSFAHETLNAINALGVSLDVDIYVLGDDEKEHAQGT